MQRSCPTGPFSLAEFSVRPSLNEIEGPDGIVRLNPKAMGVLVALAGRPKELCTKQELLDAVWPEQFVGDDVLSTAVWELRKALGDSAREPRFIQTVSRGGYRLMILPLVQDRAQVPAGTMATPRRVGRGMSFQMAVLLAVVVVFAIGLWWSNRDRAAPSSSNVQSLVVLPFENLGGDVHDERLATGLTDTLITAVAKLEGLRVVSRTTSETYQGRSMTVSEIADELAVDAVVEGTLARSADRIVVNVQLIDARNEDHIWAETYERQFSDLLDLQVEIARSIGGAISLKVGPPDLPQKLIAPAEGESLLRWRFPTSGEIWSTPVAAGDSTAVFGSRDGLVYALDVVSGREVWHGRVGNEVVAPPVMLGDTVIAVARDGTIVAFDVDDGRERWRAYAGSEVEGELAVAHGLIFSGGIDGSVHAFDGSSGRKLWTAETAGGAQSVAIGGQRVFVASFRGVLFAFDLRDGTPLWRSKVDEYLLETPVVVKNEVIVAAPSGWIISYDTNTGREEWRSPQTAPSAPVAWRDRLLAGGEGAEVRAFEKNSGSELWRYDTLSGTTRPSVFGELAFVGGRDNSLYAIDVWSGELQWRVEMRSWVTTPALVIGNAVLFGSLDGSLLCLEMPPRSGIIVREVDEFVPREQAELERQRTWDIVRDGNDAPRPAVRWRAEIGGPVLHQPLFAKKAVFAAGHDSLVALRLADGLELWRHQLPGQVGSAPVQGSTGVIIGARDGSVVLLDESSGAEKWRCVTGGAVVSTPVVNEGRVFFGSRDGFLYCLEENSGAEIWRRQLDTIHASPLLIGGRIWVPSRGDKLWVLNARDGRIEKTLPTSDWAVADPVANDRMVVIASCDGTIEARSVDDAHLLWQARTTGEIWFRPLLNDVAYFFGSADHHLYALASSDGRELWRRRTGNRVLSSVVAWRGLVFAGSHDRSLHALRAEDGARQWRLVTTGIVGNPAVCGDMLATGSFDGFLYLLDLDP